MHSDNDSSALFIFQFQVKVTDKAESHCYSEMKQLLITNMLVKTNPPFTSSEPNSRTGL